MKVKILVLCLTLAQLSNINFPHEEYRFKHNSFLFSVFMSLIIANPKWLLSFYPILSHNIQLRYYQQPSQPLPCPFLQQQFLILCQYAIVLVCHSPEQTMLLRESRKQLKSGLQSQTRHCHLLAVSSLTNYFFLSLVSSSAKCRCQQGCLYVILVRTG